MTWLVYTVLLGLVPIVIRILVASFVSGENVPFFSAADFISLGMVMQISLLTEIRYHDSADAWWKKIFIGFSIFAIMMYAVMVAFTLLSEVVDRINKESVFIVCMSMPVVSFALCWALYDRVAYLSVATEEVAND
ncbi:hypothetical protein [Pseudomonas sp. LS-2]|uniref:hypothetical protein n=1 Tax=Pseudomonas sp. LS-2 TaxID=2315859 RepID=UPI000E763404|nr:hypothetical protein [Pseudomonas sp. LS-2]RJX81305.1 hypothetical protein D3M70_09175 [Pseudomonas sp. LS-2]